LDGEVGKQLPAVFVTRQGRQAVKGLATLLPPRPLIGEVQYTPMEAKATGLAIRSTVFIASTSDPSQVSLLAAKGYRFPSDPTFRVAIRNVEDPSEVRTILPAKIRVMGRNQKATFTLNPAELLGGRASGKLELQVQDDHAGPSDWMPLPPIFMELPTIGAIQAVPAGFRLSGQSLDQIEALAASLDGPWEKTSVTIEEGHEVAMLAAPPTSSTCFIRLFGWPDLPLSVKLPAPPAANPPSGPPVPPPPPAATRPESQAPPMQNKP
jgi:hypothetical protein